MRGVFTLEIKLCTMHQPKQAGRFPSRQTQAAFSVVMTSLAVPCWELSCIPYVFRHCDLLVLTIIISPQCHEKKLEIKEDSFTNRHSKGLAKKVKIVVTIFRGSKKYGLYFVTGVFFSFV